MAKQNNEVPDQGQVTVYFDGACPLCTAEIAHYARRDTEGALRFQDVSQPDADTGSDLCQTDAMARFHVRRADGSLASGAAGFAEVWRVVPGWRWLGQLCRVPGVTGLLELAYRGFLPLRPALVRLARPFVQKNPG